MPEFNARVAMPSGEIVERSYVADSESALRRQLEGDDCLILDLKSQSALFGALSTPFQGRISQREFLFFNQELAALIRAGLPIINSLDILIERRKNERFKRSLIDIRNRVKAGESLSEAFEAQGELFPKLYSASLASGERSGELAGVLGRYIEYTRSVMAVQRKVISALIYPVILLVLSSGLIAVLVFFIIPKFSNFLSYMDVELPMATQAMVAVANFATGNWIVMLISAVVGLLAFLAWRKTPGGQYALDHIRMRLPLVGSVARDYAQNRFTRTLATLQAGGIPLVTSLELSARAVGNKVYEKALLEVTGHVREGKPLWESLEGTNLLSDIAVEMVKVGESTGALDEMLNTASEFTDEEIDFRLARIVAMIEPMLLIFMAAVVGFMVYSIWMPMIGAVGGAGV
ncbi:hypothetical protein ABI59_02050 [Acidobacteria bacterium Mor1]|nr:hypothetical protein ABI59_02050 [Acidobacteria bacterium Mor1]